MSRSLNAIWCDDIRIETGNKQSLMGIYFGQMILPAIPLTLPKLCVSIFVRTPLNQPFKELKVVIYKDEDVFAEINLGDSIPHQDPSKDNDDGAEFFDIGTAFVFSPMQIDSECIFRVKAFSESGEIRGQGLKVSSQKLVN